MRCKIDYDRTFDVADLLCSRDPVNGENSCYHRFCYKRFEPTHRKVGFRWRRRVSGLSRVNADSELHRRDRLCGVREQHDVVG
jgi:hypothetical protein